MAMFEHLAKCSDLTVEDADAACASRAAFVALLDRLGAISAPGTGAPTVLIALARLASNACEWVDGDLVIDLLDVDDQIEVGVTTELGAGMRERLFAPVRLRAPLSEVTAALEAKPGVLGALSIQRRSWKRITLGMSERVRRLSRPPRISEASLVAVRVASAPVKAPPDAPGVDSGWDDPEDG